jgi:hypothetical protein
MYERVPQLLLLMIVVISKILGISVDLSLYDFLYQMSLFIK